MNVKSWLITTSAPYLGTEQHYAAYAEDSEEVLDYLYDSGWFSEECQELWDSYSFRCEDGWQEEWDEMSDEDKKDLYGNDYDKFMKENYNLWCEDCGLEVSECEEEDLDMYVPGGEGHLEVVYDKRQ